MRRARTDSRSRRHSICASAHRRRAACGDAPASYIHSSPYACANPRADSDACASQPHIHARPSCDACAVDSHSAAYCDADARAYRKAIADPYVCSHIDTHACP